MSIGRRIIELEQATAVSNGANYLVETSAGTQRIRHDDLSKAVGKNLSIGDLDELLLEAKNIIDAINMLKKKIETDFSGTDGISSGVSGIVPAPKAADIDKFLSAKGSWELVRANAEEVMFKDNKNAETKLGAIDGITSDLNSNNSRIAASSVAAKNLNTRIQELENSALRYKGVINTNNNLDNIKEAGWYYCSTASLPVNSPYKNAYILEVYNAGTTSCIQRATRFAALGRSSWRGCNNGEWTKWTEIGDAYIPGDSISISGSNKPMPGFITSSGKDLCFSVSLAYPISYEVSKVTLKSGKLTVRGISGYVLDGADAKNIGTIDVNKTIFGIGVVITSSSAFNATNNTPVSVVGNDLLFELE